MSAVLGEPEDAGIVRDAVEDSVDVSVVIACRDEERFLARQLAAVAAQECSLSWELVIADNGSTDRSIEIAEGFRSRVPSLGIVDASGHAGPAAARNEGVRQAKGRLLIFCDADDEVAPGWLAAMARGLEKHPLVAARLDHELLNPRWSWSMRRSQGALLQTVPPFMPYTFCAAMGVRREVHDRVGGFDESLRAGEDRDYCYRLQLAGVALSLVEDAVVHYRHRDSAIGRYRQARGYGYCNVQLYHDYRQLGLGRPSPNRALLSWLALPVEMVLALRSRPRWLVWMARAGWRVGRLEGCLRYRIWAL